MGVISTVPMPALAREARFQLRFFSSTALPNHHQRTPGLFSVVNVGHSVAALFSVADGWEAKAVRLVRAAKQAAVNWYDKDRFISIVVLYIRYQRIPCFNSSGESLVYVFQRSPAPK